MRRKHRYPPATVTARPRSASFHPVTRSTSSRSTRGARRDDSAMNTNSAYAATSGMTTRRMIMGSASEEESPATDEQVPAEPQPQPEQHDASEPRSHESPEDVRHGRPLRRVREGQALPRQQQPDEHDPPGHGDRPHPGFSFRVHAAQRTPGRRPSGQS